MSVHYVRITPDASLPDISIYTPFKAVIILDAEYAPDWRTSVSRWLLHSGCRYVMAWGADCEAWHDAVDWAELEDHSFGETPDDEFTMTTWHEDETLESVFWFAQFCATTTYDDVELNNAVLLDSNPVERQAQLLELWEQSKSLPNREGTD